MSDLRCQGGTVSRPGPSIHHLFNQSMIYNP